MADILPHQNPVSGPLSFRHMYNAEYRPGEDELINYRVQRRKRMESFDPNTCPKCGDECECGPDCNCGENCNCCGSVSEAMKYTHAAVDKKGLVIGFASDEKDAKDMARRNSGKVVKLKKPMSDKKGDMMVNRPFKENTLMRFKKFFSEAKNYQYSSAFFVNDKTDTFEKIMKGGREGVDETDLADYLAQKTGKDRDKLYMDGSDLVWGAKTIAKRWHKTPISKLLDIVKKQR